MPSGKYFRTKEHREKARQRTLEQFSKGMPKETRRKIGNAHRGRKQSEDWIRKRILRDEKHGNWKGDDVGLYALHVWVKRRKPKPQLCECCYEVPPYDLANISGDYRRDVDDFEWICRHCHMKKDGRIQVLYERRWKK